MLILRFQIEEGGGGGQAELLEWCNSVLNPQGITVSDFKKSWQDGRAFCGLVNALEPGSIDLDLRTPDRAGENMDCAFDLGDKLFSFARILDAEDVLEEPDDLSIMCYVSFYRGYLKNNSAFAPLCYAEGLGLTTAVTSKPAEFTVFAVNQGGERATTGKAPVRCRLIDENGEEVAKVVVADNKNGTYSCRYTSEIPGVFKLHICIRNDDIKASPFSPNVLPGEPSPGNTVASGDGLTTATAGVKAEFTIHAKDITGADITEGGTSISGALRDPTGDIPIDVKDNGDGTYSCSYVPKTSGPVQLDVNMSTKAFGEGPIAGAPFTPVIKPSTADPSRSIATGEGVEGAQSGEESNLRVQARDKFDNDLITGGDKVAATLSFQPLSGGAAVKHEVGIVDNGNGTYDLAYTPTKVGNYDLLITIDGKPIKDMPVSVSVLPGRFSPMECTFDGLDLDGNGRRIVTAGKTDTFNVIAKDANGNQLQEGGLNIEGILGGTADVSVMCADNGDGTYSVSYTPTLVGPYQLEVKVEGQTIGGGKNPFPILVISGAADASRSIASGPGLTEAKIGEVNQFTIEARDAHDNPVTMGGANIGGTLELDGEVIPIEAVDNGDGTYTCSYPAVAKAGTYKITPTLDGHPVKDAPFELVVAAGIASPESSEVTLAQNHFAGLVGATVQLRDEKLNPLEGSMGDVVLARLLPLSRVPVHVVDNGDGVYDTTYPAGITGNVELSIAANGSPVPGSPWQVNVMDFPQPASVQAQWNSLLPASGSVLLKLLKHSSNRDAQNFYAELASKK